MAGNLLMSISQDENEHAVFRSRRMYESDLISNLATAEDVGRKEGRKEGFTKGEIKKQIEIAKNLLAILDIKDVNMISKATGLSIEEIKKLM